MAKTTGLGAMVLSMSLLSILATDRPRKTSASLTASASVLTSRSVIHSFLYLLRSVLFLLMTPLLSTMTMFSFFTPRATYRRVHELAAAPAPHTTTLMSEIFSRLYPVHSEDLQMRLWLSRAGHHEKQVY